MNLNRKKEELGFTLVDILVAATIMTFMTGILLSNFSKARVNLTESSAIIISAIRKAEAKSISSAIVRTATSSHHPCGYGVKYNNSTSVSIFAGPIEAFCTENKYDGNYSITETIKLVDPRVDIKSISGPFNDIFFKPPDPKLYLNGIANYGSSERIIIGRVGFDCSEKDCQTICIYGSGRIETYSTLLNLCP